MEQETTLNDAFDEDLFSLKNITEGLEDEGLQDDTSDMMMNDLNYDDEYSLGYLNNPMLMVMKSIMGDSGQIRSNMASFTDIHALATANLISQTQEAIIQEYNIDFENPDYFGSDFTQLEPVVPEDLTEAVEHLDEQVDGFTPIGFTSDSNRVNRGFLEEISDIATAFDDTNNEILHRGPVKTQNIENTDYVTIHEDGITDHMNGSNLPVKDKLTSNESVKCADTDKSITRTEIHKDVKVKRRKVIYKVRKKQTQDKDENSEGTMCELCGKSFKNKKGLHNHQTSHNPLQCPVPSCGRTFNYPSHYKYHLLTHSQERNYNCECGKEFYTSQQLEIHQRSHTLDKPFTCDVCGKGFSTAGNLKNHQRLHTGEKPYTCNINDCNKSFTEVSSLKKHQLTHSGVKPYKCSICNKGFTQSSSRSYHMKHKHANQSINLESVTSLATLNQSAVT